MAKRAEGAVGVRGRMRRQGPLDRFDESVGEDERIAAGSFNMDPGMRAPDEFSDVASAGYRENAKRVAERGGAKQYATSVEEEEADTEAGERRKQLMFVLAALIGGGAGGMGASRAMGPGARPGLGVGARNPSRAEWNAMKEQRELDALVRRVGEKGERLGQQARNQPLADRLKGLEAKDQLPWESNLFTQQEAYNLLSNSSANRTLGKVLAEAQAAERAALKKSFHLFRGGKNTP
jgi:hypothetical protein